MSSDYSLLLPFRQFVTTLPNLNWLEVSCSCYVLEQMQIAGLLEHVNALKVRYGGPGAHLLDQTSVDAIMQVQHLKRLLFFGCIPENVDMLCQHENIISLKFDQIFSRESSVSDEELIVLLAFLRGNARITNISLPYYSESPPDPVIIEQLQTTFHVKRTLLSLAVTDQPEFVPIMARFIESYQMPGEIFTNTLQQGERRHICSLTSCPQQ